MFRRWILAAVLAVALTLGGLMSAAPASANDVGTNTNACAWQVGWCGCTVYHWTSGHDDVNFYYTFHGYNSGSAQSAYVGAGWTAYYTWYDGQTSGGSFTVHSWGDAAIGGCGIYT